MTHSLPKTTNELELLEVVKDKLEELFPKGKCKERGAALVLYAYFHMAMIKCFECMLEEQPKKYTHEELQQFYNRFGEETFLNWLSMKDNDSSSI